MTSGYRYSLAYAGDPYRFLDGPQTVRATFDLYLPEVDRATDDVPFTWAARLGEPVSLAGDVLRIGLGVAFLGVAVAIEHLRSRESMIARVAHMPRRQVAERLWFLNGASLDEDECQLNRLALSSLVWLLERSDVPDPCLTVADGLIWAQWEWDEFTSYLHFGADGYVDYGRFRTVDGEPLMHEKHALPYAAYDESAPGT